MNDINKLILESYYATIHEAFDSAYDYEWKGKYKAIFEYTNGEIMEVTFHPSSAVRGLNLYDVSFKPVGSERYEMVDAKGNQIKIMSTVIKIAMDFYETNKDDFDGFVAEGSLDAAGKRNRIYNKIMNIFSKKIGGSVKRNGKEVYWVAPSENEDISDLSKAVKELAIKIRKGLMDGVDESEFEEDIEIGKYTFELIMANLFRGGVIELDMDNSDPVYNSFSVNFDIDKFYDMGNEEFAEELDKDIVHINNISKKL